MKKLSELKIIRVIAVLLLACQAVTPVLAADNIQMVNNQPIAVISAEQQAVAPETPRSTQSVGFEAGALSQPVPPSQFTQVPAGFQATQSNPNYAYRVSFTNQQNPMQGNAVLTVRNLSTGEEKEVYSKSAAQEDIWDKPDVSADGKHLVFLTRVSPSGVNLYTQELKEGGIQRVISLGNGMPKGPGTISFSGNEAVVQMAVPALRYRVNLTTGKVLFTLTQAAAWSLAKSNSDFKLAKVHVSGYSPAIYVLNSDTNTINIVWTKGEVDFYDVSPDGQTLIYGKKANLAKASFGSTIAVSLKSPSQEISLSGPVQYRFTTDNKLVVQNISGNPISVVDLNAFRFEPGTVSGQNYLSSPDGLYQIKDEMGTGRVHLKKAGIENWKEVLFDASESPILSVMVTNSRLYYVSGADTPTIKYIDLDAINFKLPNPSILPASVKKIWTAAGVSIANRESVQFSQEEGTVSFQDKAGKTQTFLLGSSSAWSVVASNKSFAYRLVADESGQAAALKILNLKTGQIHSVVTLDNGGMNGEIIDVSKLAVSPDGKTVVYEKGNRAGNFTVVSSIETPEVNSRELVGSLTKAPVFSGAQVALSLLPSGESKPVLVSLNTKTLMTAREQTIAGYFQTLLSRVPTWDELAGYADPGLSYAAIRTEILLSAERLDRIHEIVSREFGFEVKPETVLYFAKQGQTYAQIKVDAATLFKLTPKQFLSNW